MAGTNVAIKATTGAGSKPRVKEIHKASYTWKKLLNLWTCDPNAALFFPEKEITLEDGTTRKLDSCYMTELEYENSKGVTETHKIKLYGQLAERANERLKQKQCQALVWCEGHVKQETWIDDNGFEHVGHSTIIKPHNFKLLKIKPYESVYIDPDLDPFEAFDAEIMASDDDNANDNASELPFSQDEINATQAMSGSEEGMKLKTDDLYVDDAPF